MKDDGGIHGYFEVTDVTPVKQGWGQRHRPQHDWVEISILVYIGIMIACGVIGVGVMAAATLVSILLRGN